MAEATNYFVGGEGKGFKSSVQDQKALLGQLIAQHGTAAQGIFDESLARAQQETATTQGSVTAAKGATYIPPTLAAEVAAQFQARQQTADAANRAAAASAAQYADRSLAAEQIYKDSLAGDASLAAAVQTDIDAAAAIPTGGGGGGGGGGRGGGGRRFGRGYGRRGGGGGGEGVSGFVGDEGADGISQEMLDMILLEAEKSALRWQNRERSSPYNSHTIPVKKDRVTYRSARGAEEAARKATTSYRGARAAEAAAATPPDRRIRPDAWARPLIGGRR